MKKCMCIILSLLLTMSFLTVSAGSTDPKALIENLLSDHKNSSITAQENALLIAESYYNNIKDYENTQSPWSDVSASLLTSQLINKQSFRRTCELEYLRENEVTLSGSPSQALTDLLDSFVADNTAIDANYNFVDSAAAEEYSNLENDLTSVYSILLNLLDEASSAGIDVLVDGSPYTTATIDSTIDNMMADKIINLMKSIGSVMFSTKNTYQAALNGLFSDINIKLIGSMFGKDFAEAFADADTSQAIYDFMTGDDFLSQIISSNNFSDLFTKNAESANTAVSDIIAEENAANNTNQTAMFSGVMTFVFKISNALSLFLIGLVLDIIKFDSSQPVQALKVQNALGIILIVGVALSLAVSISFFSHYDKR